MKHEKPISVLAGFTVVNIYRSLARLAVAGLIMLCCSSVYANIAEGANCWLDAAKRYGVSPQVLYAIAQTESGMNPLAVGRNKNGSVDIGLMQINSSWLPKLSQFGIRKIDLWDACLNIHVGAWVLAGNMRQHGNTWKAIGAYNAKSEEKQLIYAWKVYRKLASN